MQQLKQETSLSDYVRSLSDSSLYAEIQALYHLIYVEDCFGVKDMLLLNYMTEEAEHRDMEPLEESEDYE